MPHQAFFAMNPEASKAKRCLFGRPDHQELERDLKRELNKDAEEMNEKWGFDFEKGKPLDGTKFEWEEVKPAKEKDEQPAGESSAMEMANKEITEKKSVDEQSQLHKTPPKNPR